MMWKFLKRGLSSRVSSLQTGTNGSYLQVSEEVKEALLTGKGVVALESTIITHGMPYPHNFSTALSVERKVRDSGAVPATVAVLNGQLRVGLNDTELLLLAEKSSKLIKISRRDLSYVLSQKLSGGTTVSGTMIAAHMAGIKVFATGGIGGVHRGAETSFDVSADLTELGRTPVAVVSSGVKSILDIPKTLEYLETQGVFVSSFGDSRDFPAFFTPKSGSLAPYNSPTVYEAAKVLNTQLDIGLSSGMLFAVPIPEEYSACGETIENAVRVALHEARKQSVFGKAVTPFVLKEVNKLTEGESLQANIALVENNAHIAGAIAHCSALIQQGLSQSEVLADPFIQSFSAHRSQSHLADDVESTLSPQSNSKSPSAETDVRSKEESLLGRPVVVGATVMDLMVQVKGKEFQMNGATYPGKVSQSYGGVGRNLADCLSRLEANPIFVSAVGKDSHSDGFFASCKHMDLNGVQTLTSGSTATYCPILGSSGQLLFGVGDMDINTMFDAREISDLESTLKQAPVVIIDSNFSPETIHHVVNICHEFNVPVWFEPTDINKAERPFHSEAWKKITFTSPNLAELHVMWKALMKKMGQPQKFKGESNLEGSGSKYHLINESLRMCHDLVAWMPVILLTLGEHGALLCTGYSNASVIGLEELKHLPQTSSFQALYYPAVPENMEEPVITSVSGAGDCLSAAVIASLLQGKCLDTSLKVGMLAANYSLHSDNTVPASVNPTSICQEIAEDLGWTGGLDVTHGFDLVDGSKDH